MSNTLLIYHDLNLISILIDYLQGIGKGFQQQEIVFEHGEGQTVRCIVNVMVGC